MASTISAQPISALDSKNDLLTVAAIATVVSAVSGFLHEGVGHGGASLLVGSKPLFLSSMNFVGDQRDLSRWAVNVVAAGGTVINLLAGCVALACLRRPPTSPSAHYALWLFALVNLLVGTGYFFFSGISNIGDWAVVIGGLRYHWVWRVLLTVVGIAAYWLCLLVGLSTLRPFLNQPPYRRANELMLTPYFVGAALSLAAGLFNPAARALILISAAAASLGGTCGLVWGPQLLRGVPGENAPGASSPKRIERSWAWLLAAALVGVFYIVVLGRGIKFA